MKIFVTCSFLLTIFTSLVIANHQHELPVIIDTDGAIDDIMAIIYALKSKELDVRGITHQGDGFSHAGIIYSNIRFRVASV